MTTLRNALLTTAVLLACAAPGATPTLAQEGMNPIAELQMMYVDQQGRMPRWNAGRGSHARMMKVGKPVPAGTISIAVASSTWRRTGAWPAASGWSTNSAPIRRIDRVLSLQLAQAR
jgi:hypothetical protein